jgi:hypothetical protein
VSASSRAQFDDLAQLTTRRHDDSLQDRGEELTRLICTDLYPEPPGIALWLHVRLLSEFKASLERDIWGDVPSGPTIHVGTANVVANGRNLMRGGAHVARDTRWYCQLEVQRPPISASALAEDYIRARQAAGAAIEGTKHSPRQTGRRAEVVNDSNVLGGAKRAKALLFDHTVVPDCLKQLIATFRKQA